MTGPALRLGLKTQVWITAMGLWTATRSLPLLITLSPAITAWTQPAHVQKHGISASHMPQSPSQGSPGGGGGLMRWGALGSALRSLEDEAKRTG